MKKFNIVKALKKFEEIDERYADYKGDDDTFERLLGLCKKEGIPPENALHLIWFCRGIEEGINGKKEKWFKGVQ